MSKYEKTLRKKLRIAHVFPAPNSAYGPGMVLMHTRKSGYTKALFGWDVLGISEAQYQSSWIASNLPDVQRSTTMSFKIALSEAEIAKLDAEFQTASECTIGFTNGKQYDTRGRLAEMIKNIISSPNREEIENKRRANPDADFILTLVSYGYSFEFNVKTSSGWKASAVIPETVLDVIAPKIEFSLSKTDCFSMTGKDLFVGFNGDAIPYIDDSRPMIASDGGSKRIATRVSIDDLLGEKRVVAKPTSRVLNITSLFK